MAAQVEFCAGAALWSDAMRDAGFQGKRMDLEYSRNHDFLRSIGLLALIMAAACLQILTCSTGNGGREPIIFYRYIYI